jgi:ketosteroid isomerase-like protein
MSIANETDLGQVIIGLERAALDRWGAGDPGGYLDVYDEAITYFDPVVARLIEGHAAMTEYYRPWTGKIRIDRYDMIDPHVVVGGEMAVLAYNLVNYVRGDDGVEAVKNRWNSTAVYQRRGGVWKIVHSHWSYTEAEPAGSPD